MKLTRQEILNLNQALSSVGNLTGVRFAYAVARSLDKLKPEIEAIRKASTPKENFVKYDQERVELAKNYAIKVDGKPQTIVLEGREQYKIQDAEGFNKELEALKVKHKEAIDEQTKREKDIMEILKEPVEIELHMVDFKYVPQEISTQQMAGILPIVREDIPLTN